MGEEEQRVRSFSSETRAKSKASRQAGQRSQEKRVLKFVKVSTTKKQAPQTYISSSNGEVFSEKDFFSKKAEIDKQDKSITSRSNKQRTKPKGKNKSREN